MLTKKSAFIILSFLIITDLYAQWNQEWTSGNISYNTISGWLSFDKSGDTWETRFYALDSVKFSVMQDNFSTQPQFTYFFTEAEKLAGFQIYSLQKDLTGDLITEFYVLGYWGTGEPYRQSVKIFDIVTGAVLFEKNDPLYYYSYPTVWDVDRDGIYECTLAKYDYPNFIGYDIEAYNTGVTVTGVGDSNLQLRFELKQNYPNPFNPTTVISYEIKEPSDINIDIFDVKGERIKTLESGYKNSGKYSVRWDGTNNRGERVSSGPYFYQLRSEDRIESKKMLLLK